MIILRRHLAYLFYQCRHYCSESFQTSSWQINRYGGPEELKLNISELPYISRPNDVLVQICAASVNPIDVKMLNGYGSQAIAILHKINNCSFDVPEFPITLGRDFSGIVIDVGQTVKKLKRGDQVWGAIGPDKIGSHAKHILVDSSNISLKPTSIDHVQAASLPYAALTSWSALCWFGGLSKSSAWNSRVLVLGGSGGVGSFSIQLLKAWNAEVTVTCSTDAVEMLENLGADCVLDYRSQDIKTHLSQTDGFDFILDCVGGESKNFALNLLKKWKNCKYVTLSSPLLNYTDKYGVIAGSLFSLGEAALDTIQGVQNGQAVRWAYFCPSGETLSTIKALVDDGKISPVVEQVFPYEDTPEAYRKVLAGHARGKTVIRVED
ncbi:reticulon-4-interacting protein 1 homolog, mitochondrial-like [Centruroides vittatus]|uniref:reticulon-4-interacting protein 1 homolog, mitochondrial-like n=1 Tax=Centruroides vittatus TaxID=120091 RepID=UPI00350FEE7C